MRAALASICAAVAAWCSLGTIGFVADRGSVTRVALLPRWWWLPVAIAGFLAAVRVTRLTAQQASPLFASAILLLPWLPVPLPPAAFLWTGPLTAMLWILIFGAVAANRWAPVTTGWLTASTRAPVVAASVALVLYGVSAWRLAPLLPDGDSPHYLILAQSIIKDGDIQIENNHLRGDYLQYSLLAAQPDYLRRGVNGQIYSIHAPGLPLVIAPVMWLFGYPGVVTFLGIVAAVTTGAVWWLALRLTGDAGAAWFAWACCALTAPFFFLATEVFPDGLAATCLLLGTLPLFLTERTYAEDRQRRFGSWVWWTAGAALALLPWLQTRLASLAAMAALLLILRRPSARELVAFVALPAISAASWFAFFWVVYGTPNPAAPYGALTQSSVANMARGLPGVLFDQQFGLIPNAPVYGVVLCGVITAAFRLRRWSLELLTLAVPYTISVTMYQHWWGGASAAGRLLTPLTPIVALGAARLWAQARAASRVVYAAALGSSVFIGVLLWVPADGRLLINFRDGIALWLEWAHDDIALARALPTLFVEPLGAVWLKAAVWAGAALAAWFVLRLLVPDSGSGRSRPRLSWLAIAWLAVVPMIALTLAWRIDRVSPVTAARSELGLLRALSRRDLLAWDYGSRRTIDSAGLRLHLVVNSDDQRPRSSPTQVLSAYGVPAGRYRVRVDGRSGLDGTVTLRLGDTPLPFLTTTVAALVDPAIAKGVVTLPSDVQSVVVEGDAAAARAMTSARLQAIVPPVPLEPVSGSAARRAARYQAGDAFFRDDNAYPEPTGFWVAGGRRADVVIAHEGPPLSLFLRNAPVDNVVTVDLAGVRQEVMMGPGEERELSLARPQSGSVSSLQITSRSGFRPSEHEPGNKDMRYLGCWVELR